MEKFDAVLFDFDGTVADTSPGIKEGLRHTFDLNNLPQMTDKEMDVFIGPPLDDSFEKYCGVDREYAKKMVLDFRAHYHEKAIDKFVIYPKIEDCLKMLKEKGLLVGIATSKPEIMAIHILEKAGILKYFDIVQGASLDGKLIKKVDIVKKVLEHELLKGKTPIMVGDTEFDIIGAHKNNIAALWVDYGFGTKEEAEKEMPEYMAENVCDMIKFFENM